MLVSARILVVQVMQSYNVTNSKAPVLGVIAWWIADESFDFFAEQPMTTWPVSLPGDKLLPSCLLLLDIKS